MIRKWLVRDRNSEMPTWHTGDVIELEEKDADKWVRMGVLSEYTLYTDDQKASTSTGEGDKGASFKRGEKSTAELEQRFVELQQAEREKAAEAARSGGARVKPEPNRHVPDDGTFDPTPPPGQGAPVVVKGDVTVEGGARGVRDTAAEKDGDDQLRMPGTGAKPLPADKPTARK